MLWFFSRKRFMLVVQLNMSIQKWLILALLISSGFGYLEWGQDQRAFFFEMEWTVFKKLLSNPSSVIHPLIILPLLGQCFLLWALFKSSNSNWVLKSGIYLLLPLFLLVFAIGPKANGIFDDQWVGGVVDLQRDFHKNEQRIFGFEQ